MSNTHKRYDKLSRAQVQDLLNREFNGSAQIDSILDNGDVLINQGGSFRKMKLDDVNKLIQKYVHVQEDNAQSNVAKVRAEIAGNPLVAEGYDASIRSGGRGNDTGNPFHGKNPNRPAASGFGSPTEVLSNQHDGLPSQNDPQHHGLPSASYESRHTKTAFDNTGAGGLPSAQRK